MQKESRVSNFLVLSVDNIDEVIGSIFASGTAMSIFCNCSQNLSKVDGLLPISFFLSRHLRKKLSILGVTSLLYVCFDSDRISLEALHVLSELREKHSTTRINSIICNEDVRNFAFVLTHSVSYLTR